ncbi:hypothetical protein EUTSA_v10029254mg [Eutrema salsugineum]|uniref:S-protein homolog n=1 Tax=Eutrema salsugineum TaxID=72664 RepID=V4L2D5_EUTSA|nr:S-protein homolog 9 [Eutrema salsugineum]ESQ37814.1 hypothetical protein EUTSA_v10029254mg [Eutrema salsugineum]
MNRFSCFLFVIVLCVGLGNAKLWEKNSVHFRNSLHPGNILTIRCQLNKDDLGFHDLKPGETYDFSFRDSLFKTKVDCALQQGGPNQKFHANFRAYKGGGLIVHYGKKNFWDAREDGIYFTHGKEAPKLEYKWIPF